MGAVVGDKMAETSYRAEKERTCGSVRRIAANNLVAPHDKDCNQIWLAVGAKSSARSWPDMMGGLLGRRTPYGLLWRVAVASVMLYSWATAQIRHSMIFWTFVAGTD